MHLFIFPVVTPVFVPYLSLTTFLHSDIKVPPFSFFSSTCKYEDKETIDSRRGSWWWSKPAMQQLQRWPWGNCRVWLHATLANIDQFNGQAKIRIFLLPQCLVIESWHLKNLLNQRNLCIRSIGWFILPQIRRMNKRQHCCHSRRYWTEH